MKTGLVTSDTFQNHDTGPGHPEQIARITVINENFKKLNNPNILWKKPSIISEDIIKGAHDIDYINLVKNSFPRKGFSSLDESEEEEDDMLDKAWGLEPTSRLSCQAKVKDQDITVEIPKYTINLASE